MIAGMARQVRTMELIFGPVLSSCRFERIAIGFGAGYGLPWLLHYRGGAARPTGTPDAWQPPLLVPMAGATTLGVVLVGLL